MARKKSIRILDRPFMGQPLLVYCVQRWWRARAEASQWLAPAGHEYVTTRKPSTQRTVRPHGTHECPDDLQYSSSPITGHYPVGIVDPEVGQIGDFPALDFGGNAGALVARSCFRITLRCWYTRLDLATRPCALALFRPIGGLDSVVHTQTQLAHWPRPSILWHSSFAPC